jgi:hypothetical protein
MPFLFKLHISRNIVPWTFCTVPTKLSLCVYRGKVKRCEIAWHEGKTEEGNNGYVVFNGNTHDSAEI